MGKYFWGSGPGIDGQWSCDTLHPPPPKTGRLVLLNHDPFCPSTQDWEFVPSGKNEHIAIEIPEKILVNTIKHGGIFRPAIVYQSGLTQKRHKDIIYASAGWKPLESIGTPDLEAAKMWKPCSWTFSISSELFYNCLDVRKIGSMVSKWM